jgi:hypothetical protein
LNIRAMALQQLELPQLKALSLRLGAAFYLEALPLSGADERAKSKQVNLLARVYAAADGLQDEPIGALDVSLRRVAAEIKKVDIEGEGEAFDDLRARQQRLVKHLRSISCAKCAKSSADICRGDSEHDRMIVSNGGKCIAALKELSKGVEDEARGIYDYATFTRPVLFLSTSPTIHSADRGMFKKFNIGGYSESLAAPMPTSIIGLEIRERAFDWNTLCGILYVLAHETVCHGFQSIDGGTRAGAEEKCAWSEGWMDRLAFKLSVEWIEHLTGPFSDLLRLDSGRIE